MHGTTGGRDHNSLSFMRDEALDHVVDALKADEGNLRVFTLEIFSEGDLETSVGTLRRFLR
jgi:hypothetical protein